MESLKELEKEKKAMEKKIKQHNSIVDKNSDTINITENVQKSLKRYLLHSYDGAVSNYEQFLQNFFNTAIEDPSSKPGQILASALVQPDMISQLDESVNAAMAKDVDFMMYRIIKTLFDKQRNVIFDNVVRRKAILCSRRAGKTQLAARLIVAGAINENSPILYINLSFENAVAQMFDEVLNLANAINLPIADSSKSEGVINFKNGSSVKFKGNSNKTEREKLRGYKYRLVIIDEAQSQSSLQYLLDDIISPLLMDFTDSVLVVQGTPPRTKKTFWEKIYTEWGSGKDPKSKSYNWSMLDNPYIENAEEEIENLCKRKGITTLDSFIQREFYGKITYDIEAQVFKGFQTYDKIPDTFIPTHAVVGCDWGYNDPNAWVALVYNVKQNEGYVVYEDRYNKGTISSIINSTQKMFTETLKWCEERNKNFDKNNLIIVGDTNEKTVLSELFENYHLPAYPAYKYDKTSAISLLTDLLRTGIIKIPKDGICEEECELTLYKRTDDGSILNEIDDSSYHPNIIFALLYATRQYLFDVGSPLGGKSTEQKTNWEQREPVSLQTFDENSRLFGNGAYSNDTEYLESAIVWDE